MLVIISPFLTKLFYAISSKSVLYLLSALVLFWFVIPNFLWFFGRFQDSYYEYTNLGRFVILFYIGAYIKKYIDLSKISLFKICCYLLLITIFDLAFIYISDLKHPVNTNASNWEFMYHGNSLFVLIASVAIFVLFSKFNFQNRFINNISACTFGVYLIHENYFVQYLLWGNLIKVDRHINSDSFAIWCIYNLLVIFFSCAILEYLRKLLCVPVARYFQPKFARLDGLFKV